MKQEISQDGDKDKNSVSKKERKNEEPITVHGTIHIWKIVIPDYADIASENFGTFISVDASHKNSWLWVSVIRIDDFNKDPANPLSQVTVINPHWEKSFAKGKANIRVNSEFAFIDKMSEWNGLTSAVVWTYDAWKGWTIEWTHFHGFNKWPDSDAFRLWITKKINDALSMTAQWWYKSDYDKRFFGRVIMDVNLWNGFWVQLSCIAKNWKLTPTAWVCYTFWNKKKKEKSE